MTFILEIRNGQICLEPWKSCTRVQKKTITSSVVETTASDMGTKIIDDFEEQNLKMMDFLYPTFMAIIYLRGTLKVLCRSAVFHMY